MLTVGIVGLGLIGGSLAKAYQASGKARVLGLDIDRSVMGFAELAGVIQGELTEERLPDCDLLLLAAYPAASEAYLEQAAPRLCPETVVIDCLGTKRHICALAFPLAQRYGFTFVGGHPMAGAHNSGLKFARADLFRGAPMVLVPPSGFDMPLLERVKALLEPAGFGSINVTSAEEHDRIIAFTSQLAHVVSNAYIKSPTAARHKGFSAGSYRDLTRVAWLNPGMWRELFLENRDKLLFELDSLMESLSAYRSALAEGDGKTLEALLLEGCKRKKEIDGR